VYVLKEFCYNVFSVDGIIENICEDIRKHRFQQLHVPVDEYEEFTSRKHISTYLETGFLPLRLTTHVIQPIAAGNFQPS